MPSNEHLQPSDSGIKHRAVVSNFIIKDKDSPRPLIALFRRSDTVRTYQGKLAPISGTIDEKDPSPLVAAFREIEEETGLVVAEHLELHLKGKPFFITDAEIGRNWTIHPFSWILKESAPAFKIDWEHTGWEWVEPKEIFNGSLDADSVPNLGESLWRTWLGEGGMFGGPDWYDEPWFAGNVLENCLSSLRTDYDSGARYMAGIALQYLRDVVSATGRQDQDGKYDVWLQTRMTAWHLIKNGRESMNAAISNVLLLCLRKLRAVKNDRYRILEQIQVCIDDHRAAGNHTAEAFADFIQREFGHRIKDRGEPAAISVLTLSSSGTKSALLMALRKCNVAFDVRILESRPLCEGAIMASRLLEQSERNHKHDSKRLQITIATDASAAIMAKDVDLVVLGADRISEHGDVSNKTGSLPAVLCARAMAPPPEPSHSDLSPSSSPPPPAAPTSRRTPKIVILSGAEKIAKPGTMAEHTEEDNAPLQIWRIWEMAGCKQVASVLNRHESRVKFKNVFFEWVPAEYIDYYVTEAGEISKEQIKERSRLVQKLDDEIFGDL